jgi:hypothetical protein
VDRPQALDHLLEGALRHEDDGLERALAAGEARPPVLGPPLLRLPDALDRIEANSDGTLPLLRGSPRALSDRTESFDRSEFGPSPIRRKPGHVAGRAILLAAATGTVLAFGAGAGELGYPASALGEFAQKDRPGFESAPSLTPGGTPLILDTAPAAAPRPPSSPAPAASPASAPVPAAAAPAEAPTAPAPEAASREPLHESPDATGAALDEYEARCFVKIDGKVLEARGCRILREGGKSVVFQIAEGALTIDQRQGRVWTARLDARSFGNVYKTGECWGAKGFYVCDRGRR